MKFFNFPADSVMVPQNRLFFKSLLFIYLNKNILVQNIKING